MNAETIVKHLRLCAQNGDCYKCEMDNVCDPNKLLASAADLIESLQTQLAAEKRRAEKAVEDLTKLARKPITPCHSCSKSCVAPASLAKEYEIKWCKDWEWRGDAEEGDGE